MIMTKGVDLPEDNIANVQDSYKYIGIPQANGNHEETRRKPAWQILKSQLNGKNKIQAINT